MNIENSLKAITEEVAQQFVEHVKQLVAEIPRGYVDRKGASEYIGCSTLYLDRLRKDGNFPRPYILTDGGKPFFKLSEIDDFMEEHKI